MPPCPITLAIEEEHGSTLGYGVIVDISGSGARVWTDALQAFAQEGHPPEL